MLVKVIDLNDNAAAFPLLPLPVEVILIKWDNICHSDYFGRVIDALRVVNNLFIFKFFFHLIGRDVNRYLTGAILALYHMQRRRWLPTNIFAPLLSER